LSIAKDHGKQNNAASRTPTSKAAAPIRRARRAANKGELIDALRNH